MKTTPVISAGQTAKDAKYANGIPVLIFARFAWFAVQKRWRATAIQDAGANGRARHSVRAVVVSPDAFVGNRRRAEDCPPYQPQRGCSLQHRSSQRELAQTSPGKYWSGLTSAATAANRPPMFYMAHALHRHRHTQLALVIPRPVQRVLFPIIIWLGSMLGKYRGTDWPGCPARCTGAPLTSESSRAG